MKQKGIHNKVTCLVRFSILTVSRYKANANEIKDNDSVMPSDRTRGNGYTLKHSRFLLNTRKHFLTVKVTEH